METERILIVYYTYSPSGNTRKVASLIQQEVGGTLHQIEPVNPYPRSYDETVDQAKVEIRSGYKPPLKSALDSVEAYDTIFVGSPNWWSTIAPPVATFLSEHDLSGKTVVPFCTHGGGGLGRIGADVAKRCPRSTVLSCFGVYGSGGVDAQSRVSAWLRNIERQQ